MLLATYQPINPTKSNGQHKLYDILGYNPIWCVSAETMEEFLCESYFCAPNCGEELIIFETDEYDTVDKCKWYESIKNNCEEYDPAWINNGCRFKEYTVKEIKNVLFRMPMNIASFDIDFEKHEGTNNAIHSIYSEARDYQQKLIIADQHGKERKLSELIVTNKYFYQVYRDINILFRVLPITYATIITQNPLEYLRFHASDDDLQKISLRFHEWNSEDCSEAGLAILVDEFYSKFYESLSVAIDRMGLKHERNAPCPCGSGKKWKKCCGQRT